MNISWDTEESHVLLNPSFAEKNENVSRSIIETSSPLPGHIWLSTSGTQNQKWVGLSKEALLISAKAVNNHLESTEKDCWIHALPDFHVGGLSIWARSYVSGAAVHDFISFCPKWDPISFHSYSEHHHGTLTSLVPTQVYDLVLHQIRAPSHLRAVVVGGGALNHDLYMRGRRLGWPLLPSYGMTECASQIATAGLESLENHEYPELRILSHWQGKQIDEKLAFCGPSLLSCYAFQQGESLEYFDPKNQGWFYTEDRGFIKNECVKLFGRMDGIIKIGGENVDIKRLENVFESLLIELNYNEDMIIFPQMHDRVGYSVTLFSTLYDVNRVNRIVEEFNRAVLPFERIRNIHYIEKIPRTPLGKVIFQLLCCEPQ